MNAQILIRRRRPVHPGPIFRQGPPNRLEVNIVLKQHIRNLPVLFGILPHIGVIQLHNIHLVQQQSPMDRPPQIVIGKLAHRKRR